MWDGELSFSVNGTNCGLASEDKRLKSGKYHISVALGGDGD